MHRLSTYERLKLLTLSISLTGMLCMSLAGLMPWAVFAFLAAIHAVLYKWFYESEILNPKTAVAIILTVFGVEILLLLYRGGPLAVFLVRDMIITLSLTRLALRKTAREIYQIVGISFSQCLLATIFTESPLFLIGLILMVALIPMILSELDASSFRASGSKANKKSAHWAMISISIMLTAGILFYILPRPASSLIKSGFVQRNRVVYAEEVNLRKDSSVSINSDVMMRIIWAQGKAPAQFYLSGSRLEKINPDGFSRDDKIGSLPGNARSYTDRLTIYPAMIESRYVFFPYWLHNATPRRYRSVGSNIFWAREMPPVYDVRVNREPAPGVPGRTDLPDELGPVRDLAVSVAGEGDSASKVKRLAAYLRSSYAYTVERQKIPSTKSAINWFVFTGKKGSCEHFAAALAAMVRGCGIPSRVATGFLVTEFNKSGDYYIVRASDAHAWVEYYAKGRWNTVDATPYGRQIQGMYFHVLDELRFRWHRWVIQYSLDDQIRFAVSIISAKPRIDRQLENLPSYSIGLFIAVLFSWLCYNVYRNRNLGPYERIRKALSSKGIVLPDNTPHEEHLIIMKQKYKSLEGEFSQYMHDYLRWRFRQDAVEIEALTREMIRKIRSMPRKRKDN